MKTIKISLITAALLASFGGAYAQSARTTNSDGYLTDTRGDVVKNSTGLCVRTSSYNPAVTFHPDCDTAAIAQVQPADAPRASEPVKPVTPVAQSVTKNLQAEVLFNFDSAQLNAVGKAKLDQLFQELKSSNGLNVNDVIITGHTDPIGTDAYNMDLSQKRANTVQQYLSAMLSKDLLKTVAKGESDLMVTTCGDKKNAKSIACNAPNRRVQVIINGTQTK